MHTHLNLQGGESAGLARLRHYLWDTDAVAEYFNTRNGMLGAEYSTKFAPWLAAGCLSPRSIYHELQRYEATRTANKSTYWVVFELIWRDYFRCGPVGRFQDEYAFYLCIKTKAYFVEAVKISAAHCCNVPLHCHTGFMLFSKAMQSSSLVALPACGCPGTLMKSCGGAGPLAGLACRWWTPTCASWLQQVGG